MLRAMPYSAAASRRYARMLPASAIATSDCHGRNSYPNVCKSESDRTPGKRKRSQVPPEAPRASRMAALRVIPLQVIGGTDAGDAGTNDEHVNGIEVPGGRCHAHHRLRRADFGQRLAGQRLGGSGNQEPVRAKSRL